MKTWFKITLSYLSNLRTCINTSSHFLSDAIKLPTHNSHPDCQTQIKVIAISHQILGVSKRRSNGLSLNNLLKGQDSVEEG